LELRTALRSFGDFQLLLAFECRHIDLAAERRLCDVQWDRAMQVVLLPLEERVVADFEEDVEIAGGAAVGAGLAFAREPQPVAVVDARRNVHLQLALNLFETLTAALGAWVADDLTAAIAGAACPPDRKKALLVEDLAAAVASGARAWSVARFAALTL